MDACAAFKVFVKRVLISTKISRYTSLAESKKGHRKLLESLCHKFESDIRPDAVLKREYDSLWDRPCVVFHDSKEFGAEYDSVREAYDELSGADSWLIVLCDGSKGIYRPEDRWDSEVLVGR